MMRARLVLWLVGPALGGAWRATRTVPGARKLLWLRGASIIAAPHTAQTPRERERRVCVAAQHGVFVRRGAQPHTTLRHIPIGRRQLYSPYYCDFEGPKRKKSSQSPKDSRAEGWCRVL